MAENRCWHTEIGTDGTCLSCGMWVAIKLPDLTMHGDTESLNTIKSDRDTARASEAMLREAAQNLRNEVSGALGIGREGMQQVLGVTNVRCLELRLEQADTALSATSGKWLERHDAEKDAEIERLTRSNQNWQNRADYAPCPNCLRTEGMALSSRKESRQECVYCVTCGYEGPGVEGSPSRETDRMAIAAWRAEYAAARQRFLTAASRAEKAEAERDGLAAALAMAERTINNAMVSASVNNLSGASSRLAGYQMCGRDYPAILAARDARITAEARRKALLEVYERVKNLRGCNAYDVIDSIEEMAKETTNG